MKLASIATLILIIMSCSEGYQEASNQQIHDPLLLRRNTGDLYGIYHTMSKYYNAVENGTTDLLDEVFHDQWFMVDTDNPGAQRINIENKQAFIVRVREHGRYEGYAEDRRVTQIDVMYGHLAFIRVDKNQSKNSTCFFLIRQADQWVILDKLWVNPLEDTIALAETTQKDIQSIQNITIQFYTAQDHRDRAALRNLLPEYWDYKAIGHDLVYLGKEEFIHNVDLTSEVGNEVNQFLSINLFNNRFAIVRIDLPKRKETRFSILFKVNKKWLLVSERRTGSL